MSDPDEEGHGGVGRVEAFSDGVIAIIVTIMVLELHAPVAERFEALAGLWPVFLAYVLSYAYVAIYWVNHHRLFGHARRVTNALVWANMALLFWLSLVPFTTSYLGEHAFRREAMWLYLASLLAPALAYAWLQAAIARTGRQDEAARRYYRGAGRKGWFAVAVYLAGAAGTALTPWAGVAAVLVVALFWVLPASRVDEWFVPHLPSPSREGSGVGHSVKP